MVDNNKMPGAEQGDRAQPQQSWMHFMTSPITNRPILAEEAVPPSFKCWLNDALYAEPAVAPSAVTVSPIPASSSSCLSLSICAAPLHPMATFCPGRSRIAFTRWSNASYFALQN